jgi:hypothetical protein
MAMSATLKSAQILRQFSTNPQDADTQSAYRCLIHGGLILGNNVVVNVGAIAAHDSRGRRLCDDGSGTGPGRRSGPGVE